MFENTDKILSLKLRDVNPAVESSFFSERSEEKKEDSSLLVDTANNSANSSPYSLRHSISKVLFNIYIYQKITKNGSITVPTYRVCSCHSVLNTSADIVRYNSLSSDSVGHRFSGVLTCGSVWHCPICSRKITSFRASEITSAHEVLSDTHDAFMVTLTLSHSSTSELSDLLNILIKSFDYINKHNSFFRSVFFKGFLYIKSLEVTYGKKNGWHPHIHCLYFFPKELKVNAFNLKNVIYSIYLSFLFEHGFSASFERGVDVLRSFTASDYISKFGYGNDWRSGQELAKSVHKKNKSKRNPRFHPFELIEHGYNSQFCTYASVFHGKRQLTYSRKIRLFVPNFLKRDDQDIANYSAEDFINNIVVSFPKMFYNYLRNKNFLGELIRLSNIDDDYHSLFLFIEEKKHEFSQIQ